MKKELVWNVWRINPNTNEIEPYNVFKHYTFSKWLYKLKKTYLKGDDFQADKFLEEIKGWLQYCFWSKFEYEVLITDLLKRKENKIDIKYVKKENGGNEE